MNESKEKRARSCNFSVGEETLLIALVGKYRNTVECKKTDALSNKQKEHGWLKLQADFNAQSGAHARTLGNLKSKFDNIKRATKKALMLERKERFKTGGGVPNIPTLDEKSEMVCEIMGVGVEGLTNQFDSNGVFGFCQNNGLEETDSTSRSPSPVVELDILDTPRPNNDSSSFAIGGSLEWNEPDNVVDLETTSPVIAVSTTARQPLTESLSREEILQDFPDNWSAWTPALLKKKKSVELTTPSCRVKAPSSAPARPAYSKSYRGRDAFPDAKTTNTGLNLSGSSSKKISPRFDTTTKLSKMAETKTRSTELKERLIQAEYDDHKAREDELHVWRLKSVKLTVAIKQQRLKMLNRRGKYFRGNRK